MNQGQAMKIRSMQNIVVLPAQLNTIIWNNDRRKLSMNTPGVDARLKPQVSALQRSQT